jgi:hypothetical protein
MTWGMVAVGAGTLVGGYMSSEATKDAADQAAGVQGEASRLQMEEARRQFDQVQELLKPYAQAGQSALTAQQGLLGLSGPDAQQQAIAAIAAGPEMAAMQQQGENAILQNASATGGLRGGNLQGALAQFRPQLLNQLIQQRYQQLGGITAVGQNAAAGTGNAAMTSSGQVINALGEQGAAQAGAALAGGQANSQMWNSLGSTASMMGTLKLMGKF